MFEDNQLKMIIFMLLTTDLAIFFSFINVRQCLKVYLSFVFITCLFNSVMKTFW